MSDGVSFTFPAGASIAANGCVIVAKNPARVLANHPGLSAALVFGPSTGSLGDGGEEVVLGRPVTIAGPLTYFAAVDEVSFADQSRWSQWADGGGSSLELANARRIATPLWLDSDESAKAPWTLVETTGVLDNVHPVGLADRLDGCLLDAGEALVDEVEATPSGGPNLVTNGGFESGLGAWLGQGTHNRSVIESSGFAGGKSLHLVATGRGDPSPNHVRTPLTATIAANSTVTNQREQLMHWMLEQMQLPTLHRRDVHFIVNGQRRTSGTVPIYHEAHQPGGSHLESNFPGDANGRLLKTNTWDEYDDIGTRLAGPTNTLLPYTTTGGVYKTARYRWTWRPRSTDGNENDFTDFFALVTAVNTGGGYVGAVDAVADMDQWMRNFAFADLCAY